MRKPPNVLAKRVGWARRVVADWASTRGDIVPIRLMDEKEDSLGRGYVDDACGRKHPNRSAGFRQSSEERALIEKHAVDMAEAYYVEAGWKVKRKGAPFDLELRRGSSRRTVEVKGTTSMGERILVTEGEVRHHLKAFPNNALVVVRRIALDRSTKPPKISGGVLFECQPWSISADDLEAISHKYTVPEGFYGDGDPNV